MGPRWKQSVSSLGAIPVMTDTHYRRPRVVADAHGRQQMQSGPQRVVENLPERDAFVPGLLHGLGM